MSTPQGAVLRVISPDRPGIVADVSAHLRQFGINIRHADQHLDTEAGLFFQRIEFDAPSPVEVDSLRRDLAPAFEGWGMRWSVRSTSERMRVAVMISKHPHCGLDLLQRHRSGELQCEIPIVISNHPDLGEEVTRRGYAFAHEPIVDKDKAGQEKRVIARIEEAKCDLVILARYMQILTPNFVQTFPERIINIHHSFLPAFIGAEPYRQAYRRGVKLVGATSHYVTEELDEGPIIAQGVTRVSHRDTVKDMERKGRDLERVILAEAVRCHLEDRIIRYGNKTVVFE